MDVQSTLGAYLDKAPALSISIVIWILSSDTDTICQLNQFITNSEAAMLSRQKPHFLLINDKGVILSTTNSTSSLAVGELPQHHMPALPRFPYCLLKSN